MTRYMRYHVEIKGKSKLITRYARKIKKAKKAKRFNAVTRVTGYAPASCTKKATAGGN